MMYNPWIHSSVKTPNTNETIIWKSGPYSITAIGYLSDYGWLVDLGALPHEGRYKDVENYFWFYVPPIPN